ncbi:MAG: pantetheine-phosphate adenylyltransferase [Bacteroidaceae bacterium]|nr:pantetheine-phosphate adenylyltransferase [Bacteroidaceae bacterium]MBQ5705655.1 pantetheine-phosphate adenylyltransferase [Bacteroidaceae bacterium]
MEKIALFAGTFAPYTVGHHSIATRALAMFDKIIIAVGYNSKKGSQGDTAERVESIARTYADEPRIEVAAYEGLTADFAKERGACCLLRGVRSVKDFEYERDLADLNREISGLETVILPCEPQYAAISSSAVRELMSYGKDVSKFLP